MGTDPKELLDVALSTYNQVYDAAFEAGRVIGYAEALADMADDEEADDD